LPTVHFYWLTQLCYSDGHFEGCSIGKKAKELVDFAEYNVVDYDSLEYFEKLRLIILRTTLFISFFIVNIESTINEDSPDRNDIVDLLWFPTGWRQNRGLSALTHLHFFVEEG